MNLSHNVMSSLLIFCKPILLHTPAKLLVIRPGIYCCFQFLVGPAFKEGSLWCKILANLATSAEEDRQPPESRSTGKLCDLAELRSQVLDHDTLTPNSNNWSTSSLFQVLVWTIIPR